MSSPIRARLRRIRRIRRSNFRGRVNATTKASVSGAFVEVLPAGLAAEEVHKMVAPAERIVASCANLMLPGVLRWHPYMGSWRHAWHLYRQRVTYRFRTVPVPSVDGDDGED